MSLGFIVYFFHFRLYILLNQRITKELSDESCNALQTNILPYCLKKVGYIMGGQYSVS